MCIIDAKIHIICPAESELTLLFSLNKSAAKPKPTVGWITRVFPRFAQSLQSDWLIASFALSWLVRWHQLLDSKGLSMTIQLKIIFLCSSEAAKV